jgi:anti-sigma factor RsiW
MLSRFLDKEASASESGLVQSHLSVCPACQKELSELSGAKQMIAVGPRKSLPQDYLISRLRRQIGEKQKLEAGFSFDLAGSLSRRFIPVPAFAVVLSILLLVFVVNKGAAYSLEDQILNGNAVTSEMALDLMAGKTE